MSDLCEIDPWADDHIRAIDPAAPHTDPSILAWTLPRLWGSVYSGGEEMKWQKVRGRRIGGFYAEYDRGEWRDVAEARRDLVMTTVADVHCGRWSYEALYVLPPSYSGLGLGFREVWDLGSDTDNGHILLVMQRDRWVHPDTIVFLSGASLNNGKDYHRYEYRCENAPGTSTEVKLSDQYGGVTRVKEGCLAIFTQKDHTDGGYVVVWRRDGRTTWGNGLSIHDTLVTAQESLAIIAKKLDAGEIPMPKDEYHTVKYDRQQKRVYRWDHAVEARFPILKQSVDLAQAEAWVKRACELFGVRPPRVEFRPHLKRKCYQKLGLLRFAEWGQTIGTVLHETAHEIMDWDREIARIKQEARKGAAGRIESHGPEYVGVMMILYSMVKGVDRAALEEEARRLGVRWNDTVKEKIR